MCATGSIVEYTRSSNLAFSPTLSLIFTAVKKCKIWPRFRRRSTFEPLPFRNGARYLKSNLILLRLNDCSTSWPNLAKFGLYPFEPAHLGIWDPLKSEENISLIINNSAIYLPIVFKFDGRLVHSEFKQRRLTNYERPLLAKSKMADSGSKCKNKLGIRPTLTQCMLSLRNMWSLKRWMYYVASKLDLVRSTPPN